MTEIKEITENKKQYLELLLLADEQEDMIDRYLERGRMFMLYENGAVLSECVVTDEGNGVYELKNLAVAPAAQKRGCGKALIEHLFTALKGDLHEMQVGTGDSPLTIPFYEKCGFTRFRVEKNFFTDNYDHPIIEDGIQLVDMIYLKRTV